MLAACRLAGLSALEGHYGGVRALPQLAHAARAGIVSRAILLGNEEAISTFRTP
jgi:hypothetical protein